MRNDKCIEKVWKKNIKDITKSYAKYKNNTNKSRDHNNKQNTEEIIEASNDAQFRARQNRQVENNEHSHEWRKLKKHQSQYYISKKRQSHQTFIIYHNSSY